MSQNEENIVLLDKLGQNPQKPPRYLYKYYRNLDYALDVIQNDRIHLDLPADCNDVFDSARVVDIDEFNHIFYDDKIDVIVRFTHRDYKKQVCKLLSSTNKKFVYLNEVFEFLRQNNIPHDVLENSKKTICHFLRNAQVSNNRIICFTQDKKSLLMWAHYGAHLQGVCLCFDTKKDPNLFKHVYKIDYTNTRNRERNYNFYFSKSSAWRYEKEWRIVAQGNENYCYTNSCVGIILGERIRFDKPLVYDKDGKVETSYCVLTFHANEKGLRMYKAKANPTEYKIDIERSL